MKYRSAHRHAPHRGVTRAARLRTSPRLLVRALTACSVLTFWPGASELRAQVLPTGMNVVAGQATARTSGSTMTVSNSPNAIINWNSFSIGAGNSVRFDQANASSQVLNRVTGNDPSAILGSLSSNGRVWLLNPNGVLFGHGARIDVAGFVTSTLNLNNADWLAGKYHFMQGAASPAGIVNQGELRSSLGGRIALIGATVRNEGEINAPGGQILLAAGSSVELVDSATPNVSVKLNAGAGEVMNLGRLMAPGGRIDVQAATVNQSGIVRADSLSTGPGGEIVLQATDRLTLAGTSETSATADSGRGGQIHLLGREVGLLDAAQVSASGGSGGGTVLVGGGLQGKDPSVRNAEAVYFGPRASISADATRSGNGGRIILWSDKATRAYGSLSVRGGALGGDGGFIETSGGWLDARPARLDTSAPSGRSGSWLLDPFDVTVTDVEPATSGVDPNFTAVANNATIRWSDLTATLTGGTQVTVSTGAPGNVGTQAGNIVIEVLSSPPVTVGAGGSLTFIADGSIDINGTLAFNGAAMPLTFLAGRSGQGGIRLPGTTITLNNGDITFGGFTTYNRAGGGTFLGATGHAANRPTGVDLTAASIDALGGTITINGGSSFQGQGSGVNVADSNLLARNIVINGNTADFGTTGAGINLSFTQMEARQTMDLRGLGTTRGIATLDGQLILTNSFAPASLRLFGVGQQSDGVLLDSSETNASLVFNRTGGSVAIDGATSGSESAAVRINGAGTSAPAIDVSGGTTLSIGGVATITELIDARISANPLDVNGAPFTLQGSQSLTLTNSQITSGGPITLQANSMSFGPGTTITSNFAGPTALVLQGASNGAMQAFNNQAGAAALRVGAGSRWLVFATNPTGFDAGGLAYDFKRYNALPGDTAITTDVGNGLAFSVPQFATVTGNVQTKTYDGTTAATVSNLAATGVNQDQLVGSPSISSAVFGSANAGTNNNVTLNGLSLQFVDANQKPVFGYTPQVLLRGNVNPAPVTVAVSGLNKVYDTTTQATPVATVISGLVGSETLGVNSFAQFPSKDVGTYPIAVDIVLANGTNGGLASNYSVAPTLNVPASITPATLSYLAAPASAIVGAALPPLTGTVIGFVGGETQQTATAGTLGFTAQADTSAPGRYPIIGGGLSATNYTFVQDASNNTALTLSPLASTDVITTKKIADAAPTQALQSMARQVPLADPTQGGVVDLVPPATSSSAAPSSPASFEPVRVSDMSAEALAGMLDARAQYKKSLFADALMQLEKDPALADMPPCRSLDELRDGGCVMTTAQKREMQATAAPPAVATAPASASAPTPPATSPPAPTTASASPAPAATPAAPVAAAAPAPADATPVHLLAGPRRVLNASLPQIQRKVALVVGVDRYNDPTIPQLANAVGDARAVANVLESQMGYETIVLANASKKSIVAALNRLVVELGTKDSLVLYYAGHGELVTSTKLGYWQLADSDPKRPETWLSNADIARMVAQVEASQVALISDSCYSGSLVTDQRIRAATSAVDPEQVLSRRSVVVMSSGGNEPVADAGKEGHSPFAWNLMNNLRKLSAWQPGGNVFERVRFAVAKELPQRPQYGAFGAAGHQAGGEYLFEQRRLESGPQ